MLDTYRQLLRERLPEKRVLHCLSVAETMLMIGKPLRLDPIALETAGLLHDLCRNLDDETMLAQARMFGLPIEPACLQRPLLLHAPEGAEWCRRELNVAGDDIYEAIYWHTTGHPGICHLAQALFVADFCEPLRKYPEAGETRNILRAEGFAAALLYTARTKLAFSLKKEVCHPESQAFCEWVESGGAA